jgi:hypothetical protein
MNYPVDGLRKSYFERMKTANYDEDDLYEFGYTAEEIAAIKRT